MLPHLIRFIPLPILLLSLHSTVLAQPTPVSQPLLIGIHEFAPFVMAETEGYSGFDIEHWNQVAERINVKFEFRSFEDITSLIEAVQQRTVAAAIGGVTINQSREETIDFSHGYYRSGLQILVHHQDASLVKSLLHAFSNRAIGITLLFFLAFVVFTGFLYWWFERGRVSIKDNISKGVGEGMWLSYVTATTIGYGDIAPKSLLGRLATVPISLIGFMVIGSISGVVASLMTIDHLSHDINNIQDLYGKRVAIKQGTATEEQLRGQGLRLVYADSNEEAYQMVESGVVEAFVHDAPALRFYANKQGADKVTAVGNIFGVQYYGIALPQNSELRETINRAQLELSEDGVTDALKEKYGI